MNVAPYRTSQCYFNGRRDRHIWPCDTCEPEAYARWEEANRDDR